MSRGDYPAYPVPSENCACGMTIREAFAMAAMQAIVAAQESADPPIVAKFAIQYADALLAALEAK